MKKNTLSQPAKHLNLSADPVEALRQIADVIDAMELGEEQRYPAGADKRAFIGYWQPIGFFQDLRAIAHYSREIADQSST